VRLELLSFSNATRGIVALRDFAIEVPQDMGENLGIVGQVVNEQYAKF
jgi:hypothetical protein